MPGIVSPLSTASFAKATECFFSSLYSEFSWVFLHSFLEVYGLNIHNIEDKNYIEGGEEKDYALHQ